MADTSLWPIVVSGLLTGAFALGGIAVGLVGTARRDAAQERRDVRKRRADKFEELVAAVYEYEHWLTLLRQRELQGIEGIPETVSPFAKVQSISAVYFPQFNELVHKLDVAASQYVAWIYKTREKQHSKKFSDEPLGFEEVFEPYVKMSEDLLDALSKFARQGF